MSSERLLFSPDSMSILVGLMDVINRLLFHQFEVNKVFISVKPRLLERTDQTHEDVAQDWQTKLFRGDVGEDTLP